MVRAGPEANTHNVGAEAARCLSAGNPTSYRRDRAGIRFMSVRAWASALAAIILVLVSTQRSQADTLCDHYSARLSDTEISEIRSKIIQVVPARFAALAKHILIINVPMTPDEIGPTATRDLDGKNTRIEIPENYRELQCRLVAAGLYIKSSWPAENLKLLKKFMTDCDPDEEKTAVCLLTVSDAWMRSEGIKAALANATTASLHATFSDAAFTEVMLHEFAHIALGHLEHPPENPEFDADVFSMMYTILDARPYFGTFFTSSMLEFQDDKILKGDLHGTSRCRAATALEVNMLLVGPLDVAVHWILAPSQKAFLETPPKQPFVDLSRIVSSFASSGEGCSKAGEQKFKTVLREVDAVVAQLRRLPDDRPLTFYDKLSAMKLETEEGRYFASYIIAAKLLQMQRVRAATTEKNEFGIVGDKENLGLFQRAIDSSDAMRFSTENLAELYNLEAEALLTQARQDASPDLKPIKEALQKSIDLFPDLPRNYGLLLGFAISDNDCAAVLKDLTALARLSPEEGYAVPLAKFKANLAAQGCTEKTFDVFGFSFGDLK